MPKYTVRVVETAAYLIEVEADTEEAALVAAEQDFTAAENTNTYFDNVMERESEVVLSDADQ